ncbi:unnamed protein product (macronuclear) [Paramecium tetraurelia]|uniref:RBR-type E3 ubiquitin transferase n=1 Tax=Paramecium tetraurelia TaxID=5888 RepID=A0C9J1_PARTE|nr:uncharacterized protein GSPATT00006764001 [Paramecium tetraurelia]CAK67458.1 unnamed protein product [Paramecium tetraurelia]|eukprot:XP_001434855.1 hypothetical protein (macronuclear) [Paramecium tetraurelia strain d4-2]
MINYFDFSDYIRKIQEMPFVDYTSQMFHITFLSFQAGASSNNQKVLKKSFYLIDQVHSAYQFKNINLKELQQIYNDYINGKRKIDFEVPDEALQDSKNSQLYCVSSLLNKYQRSAVLSQFKQDIASKQKFQGYFDQNENTDKFINQFQQSNVQMLEKNGNKEATDSSIQNNYQQVEIQIPQIKEIYYLAIDQSKQYKQQQYEEYRNKESQKSQIFSQINKQSQIQQSTQCSICLENVQQDKYALTACQHIYHKQCLENLINAASEFPIKCPNLECREEILRDDLENIVSSQVMDRLEKIAFNQYLLQNPNVFQCPTENCKGVYEIEGPIQVCMICQNLFCTRCRRLYHEGICGEESFINAVQEARYRQCSQCQRWIEKTAGCNHITCKCGFQFCYLCGTVWVRGTDCDCRNRPQQNDINVQQIPHDLNQIQQFVNQQPQRQSNSQKVDKVLNKLGLSFVKKIFRKW